MTDDCTDVSTATDVSLVIDSSKAVEYGGEAADAKSLLVTARNSLRLVGVELMETGGFSFMFDQELHGPEEPWQHLFGVPMSKVIRSVPPIEVVSLKVEQKMDVWYGQYPQMRTIRDKGYYNLSGKRFTVTQGARAAYAAIKQELKDKHEFLRKIALEFQDLTEGQRVFSECFNVRHDFKKFVACLMMKVRFQWGYIEDSGKIIGGIVREKYKERHPVEPLDRTRILALLEGMKNNANYLDKKLLFTKCMKYRPKEPPAETKVFNTQECKRFRLEKKDYKIAKMLISMPGIHEGSYNCTPTPGASMNIKDIFTKSDLDYKELRENFKFGGDDMGPDIPDVNQYFTFLLNWDTKHCYGLLLGLKDLETSVDAGSGDLPVIPMAAYLSVLGTYSAGTLPYSRYPLKNDKDNLLDDVRKLDYKNFP
jgi:hypothetical protein